MNPRKTIVAGALGECVHVAGVLNFLRLAENAGWRTVFLGPAVSIQAVVDAAVREKADLVGVSYRLTAETGERLLADFAEQAAQLHETGTRFAFGGTPPVAERVKQLHFFEQVFDGSDPIDWINAYLKGVSVKPDEETTFPQNLVDRIHWKEPYPLLRHHYGRPTMAETIEGVRNIAAAKIIDVISLGVDQDAQENFFHPERQDRRRTGAGGVPVRSAEDYRELFQASRTGNFPLLRTYSGTDDFLRLAQMYVETIGNAWCAVPLFWFNRMDGRGPWDLEGSIREHQKLMEWYGQRSIPVELNEPHHWGMRDASDVVFIVSAFLSAYNAKKFGVKDYIAQLMFNSPPGTSDAMDLAKMMAVTDIIAPLAEKGFRIWKQTRTGLLSYPLEPAAAHAHLAASVYLQMSIQPQIIHVVGFSEADHAATAEEVIESGRIAQHVIENALRGQPDMTADPKIQKRRSWLISEAERTLEAIRNLTGQDVDDPLTDPTTLAKAVTSGILDAPQLRSNPYAAGTARTLIVEGGCEAVDDSGQLLNEEERLKHLKRKNDGSKNSVCSLRCRSWWQGDGRPPGFNGFPCLSLQSHSGPYFSYPGARWDRTLQL